MVCGANRFFTTSSLRPFRLTTERHLLAETGLFDGVAAFYSVCRQATGRAQTGSPKPLQGGLSQCLRRSVRVWLTGLSCEGWRHTRLVRPGQSDQRSWERSQLGQIAGDQGTREGAFRAHQRGGCESACVAQHRASAHPFPLPPRCRHFVARPLADQFPFELRS
jgi:hypothetical protein